MAGTALSLAGGVTKPTPKPPLVRIGTRFFREATLENGKVVLVPVEVELNLDPTEVAKAAGLAVLAAAVGAAASIVAWHGISVPTITGGSITFVKGLKETTLGKDAARAYERWAIQRRIRASGGEVVESRVGLTPTEVEDALLTGIGDTTCQLLNREWAVAKRQGRTEDAARFRQQATDRGCPWVKHV